MGNSLVPYLSNHAENALNTVPILLQTGIHAQGRWSTFDVHDSDRHMFWEEPFVAWDEPFYPEEMDDEDSPSVADDESESEFVPSESTSE
jgi:hypothetical protein